jgi:sugar phosphate isomerase/epimerase
VIRSAVTVSLVPEARGGPFIFSDDLAESCRKAAALGFDAIELFPPQPDAVSANDLRQLLDAHKLTLAAVGTGAGWVKHKLLLTSPDPAIRARAIQFVGATIDLAGRCGASAIIGSMQGRWGAEASRANTTRLLVEALDELGNRAKPHGVPLIYEPLNRYETNLANTLAEGVQLLGSLRTDNVTLLADLFHMNIEETDLPAALRAAGRHVGHVHFADSNRRPVGLGHTVFEPIASALRDIGYDRYVSAEAFAYPDPDAAARQTIESFMRYFG